MIDFEVQLSIEAVADTLGEAGELADVLAKRTLEQHDVKRVQVTIDLRDEHGYVEEG